MSERGRPSKHHDSVHSEKRTVRLTIDEAEELASRAKAAGETVSEYMRRLLLIGHDPEFSSDTK